MRGRLASRAAPSAMAGLLLLVAPAPGAAQGPTRLEVGTALGLTMERTQGRTSSGLGVPGAGVGGSIVGQPTIFAAYFPTPRWTVGPEIGVTADDRFTRWVLGASVGRIVGDVDARAGYLAASLTRISVADAVRSDADLGVGLTGGVRWVVGGGLAVRAFSGYRLWTSRRMSEVTLGLALGGIVRGRHPTGNGDERRPDEGP